MVDLIKLQRENEDTLPTIGERVECKEKGWCQNVQFQLNITVKATTVISSQTMCVELNHKDSIAVDS